MAKDKNSRKTLTFEQAEGSEPLPSQLRPKELTREFRAKIWEVIVHSLQHSQQSDGDILYPKYFVGGPWIDILYNKHVQRDFRFADEFDRSFEHQQNELKKIFVEGDYIRVSGLLQWIMRHENCPSDLSRSIDSVLKETRAAYRVIDGDTIMPVASEAEASAVERAFVDLSSAEFNGARSHLRNAASELTEGQFSSSIRESIHAVESVARILEPSADLSKALGRLEKSAKVHGAMKSGFLSLYGYTSDEKGIRHALLEKDAPATDETDALFMFGACASFVSYLINKARAAQLIEKPKSAGI